MTTGYVTTEKTANTWMILIFQGEFSSLYMSVNATLEIQNADLFELNSTDKNRIVSPTVCIVLFVFSCMCECVFYVLYVCAHQVRIQVSKETLGGIPIWIIIISILIGLLILALVIFALWKVNFKTSDALSPSGAACLCNRIWNMPGFAFLLTVRWENLYCFLSAH